MKKLTKVIIIYSVIIVIGFILSTSYHNQIIGKPILGEIIMGFNVEKITDVKREKIFDVMADIENYPNVLPNNIIAVRIINQSQPGFATTIYAEQTIVERGVVITQIVEHNIFPPQQHIITVKSGDAKGSEIKLTFKEINSKTKIIGEIKIQIQGILAPFSSLARNNIESAINTTLDSFVEYAKSN